MNHLNHIIEKRAHIKFNATPAVLYGVLAQRSAGFISGLYLQTTS